MSVREWSWWRLYVKVAPLLNVHRTEDQLKARTVRINRPRATSVRSNLLLSFSSKFNIFPRQEELELLRAKVERLEQERNHLKHDNDKLEAKVTSTTVGSLLDPEDPPLITRLRNSRVSCARASERAADLKTHSVRPSQLPIARLSGRQRSRVTATMNPIRRPSRISKEPH